MNLSEQSCCQRMASDLLPATFEAIHRVCHNRPTFEECPYILGKSSRHNGTSSYMLVRFVANAAPIWRGGMFEVTYTTRVFRGRPEWLGRRPPLHLAE